MTTPLGGAAAVRLIATREITTRMRTKAFLISNIVLLAVIVGGIVTASLLSGRPAAAQRVALVGDARSLTASLTEVGRSVGTKLAISTLPDDQTARDRIAAGRLDVALVPGVGGGYTAVADKGLSPDLRTILEAAVRQQATGNALHAQGVDPGQIAATTAGAVVAVDFLHPPDPAAGQRLALAYVSVILLYLQLLTNSLAVATGVVEEKTSRVVELLLATVKPLHLLVGKVLGIGVVGLAQLAAYGVVGIAAALATGLITITGTAVAVFAATLGWYVLGFAFFAFLYAAAGSLVSRQEEVGSTTTPLTLLVIAMFFLAQTSVQDPSGTLSSVMSWIPPFSAILMPLRIAAGVTGPLQIIGTVLLMLAVTAGLAVAAAGIYQRSVLRTGAKVSWKEAFHRPGVAAVSGVPAGR